VEHIRHRAGITTAKREKPIPVVSEERRPVSPAPKQSVQNTWRSVAELSQEERQAIVLEEGKAKDIAARYGVAPRSVYGLRERARKKGVPTVPTRQVGLAVASPEMRKRVSEMARDPNHRNPKRSSAYRLAQEHGGDLRLRKGYNRRERKPK